MEDLEYSNVSSRNDQQADIVDNPSLVRETNRPRKKWFHTSWICYRTL